MAYIKRSKEYLAWCNMKARCLPDSKNAPSYYNKEIAVSTEWQNSFDNFLLDMGKAPSVKHELDRVNNNEGYSASNCRWTTRSINCFNKVASLNKGSPHRGVIKQAYGYKVQIGIEGKLYYIGFFKAIEEASMAYNAICLEWYGVAYDS